MVHATPEDKAATLGEGFRHLHVLSVDVTARPWVTRVIIAGQDVTLIGFPDEALQTYLGGTAPGETEH